MAFLVLLEYKLRTGYCIIDKARNWEYNLKRDEEMYFLSILRRYLELNNEVNHKNCVEMYFLSILQRWNLITKMV